MAKIRSLLAASFGCILGFTASVSHAISYVAPEVDNQDRPYVGFKWMLNDIASPEFSLGFRHAQVNADGDVEGNDLSMTFDIMDGFSFDEIRAKYLNGGQDLQGEFSLGYDFTSGYFAGVSGQGPVLNLGVDYLFKAESPFDPYFMFNTIKKYDDPACPQNWNFSSGLCYPAVD